MPDLMMKLKENKTAIPMQKNVLSWIREDMKTTNKLMKFLKIREEFTLNNFMKILTVIETVDIETGG